MIGYLSGNVFEIDNNQIIVLVGGVGYAVRVPQKQVTSLTLNQEVNLYTHTHVREDELSLFGFVDKKSLKVFELLISVSGVGPKMAMNILGHGSAEQIQKAVAEADVSFFMAVSGIGKKNGQRIIVDLKSKLGSIKDLEFENETVQEDELAQGLIAMGFEPRKVHGVLDQLDRSLSEGDQLKMAIKYLQKR